MRVLVIGLGSMGKRRARLLKKAFPDILIGGVDFSVQRRIESSGVLVDQTFDDLDEAIRSFKPKAAFVCTSPISHFSLIKKVIENEINVFTELNLINDGYDEIIATAMKNEVAIFLSSTLLYRNDLQYIISKVKDKRVNYVYHSGQYLPDWHPWENYRDFFVNDKRTNGCREILAIELPWLLRAMGEVESINVLSDKMSGLDISYNDNYLINLLHKNGSRGVLVVDVVSRKATRSLEVFSEKIHMTWGGTPGSLLDYNLESKQNEQILTYEQIDHNKNYSENVIENAYLDEIYTFFDYIGGKVEPRYTFKDDLYTLALIDRIEGNQS